MIINPLQILAREWLPIEPFAALDAPTVQELYCWNAQGYTVSLVRYDTAHHYVLARNRAGETKQAWLVL
jgi:hypothetical protein